MSEEQNKEIFHCLIEEGFNKGNLVALDELFAPNFVEHQDGFGMCQAFETTGFGI